MSKRSQRVVAKLKSLKHLQSPTQNPSPERQQNNPAQLRSLKSHQSIPVIIQMQPSPSTSIGSKVASGWLHSHYLQHASSFHVVQKLNVLEATLGVQQRNEYTVMDQAGNKVFLVNEEPLDCCARCCKTDRYFTLIVKDTLGANVLVMDRGLVCSCCFGADKLIVATPSGQLLGTVNEGYSLLRLVLAIKNAAGVKVLQIKGSRTLSSCCCSPIVFQVQNLSGATVGTISKEWGGFMREMFTDANTFHISFPSDLDPTIKAICLGALFLIDYKFFESSSSKARQQQAIILNQI